MRLFLACLIPDDVSAGIWGACAPVRLATRAIRWVPADRLHLTVKFLGDRVDHSEGALLDAVRAAVSPFTPFDATVAGTGVFPNFSRPRVVWIGMQPAAPLADLAARLDTNLRPQGYPSESRPFRAHITLGRIRDPLPPSGRAALSHLLADFPDSWTMTVRELALMRSTIGASGSRYETLRTIPLGGS